MLLARSETVEQLAIFDERGQPVGRVTLPTDPRLFGAEKGTVYLQRPTPVEAAPGNPAQAA